MTESEVLVIPTKYENLLLADAAGLKTPQTLLLGQAADYGVVQDFLRQATDNARFIVRSAYSDEDGAGQSYAGHFWSSSGVTAGELPATICQAWRENLRIREGLSADGQMYLLVQEYIEHEIGGVLFAPWSFYPDYACVEYSSGGVQEVVSGIAETAIIALSTDGESPLPLAEGAAFLLTELQAACQALRTEFDVAIDCEWAWSAQEQQLVIVQVRPQTHAIGPVLPLKSTHAPNLPDGNWQYTALSESLGRLSLLSFSLLQQLYRDLLPGLRRLGCMAADSDFMWRMPDGTVFLDEELEQQLYAPTRFGGFWRGFRAEQLRQQAIKAFDEADADVPFSYQNLSQIFSGWMVSNFLSDGAGRLQQNAAHAYELSWRQALVKPLKPAEKGADSSWAALNERGKQVFMHELNKLKDELAQYPQRVFCHWQAYQAGNYSAAELEQHKTAAQAIFDYASAAQGDVNNNDGLSLAANHTVTAPAFVVQQPGQHHGQLPDGCILIAPYFDNRWVAAISRLQGIVVQRGSHLSHSVIVAREAGVPYCVLPTLDMTVITSGTDLVLDPVQKTLIFKQSGGLLVSSMIGNEKCKSYEHLHHATTRHQRRR